MKLILTIMIVGAFMILTCSPINAASFRGLGDLPGGDYHSVAYGISADGKVVVGGSQGANAFVATRWDYNNGLQPLSDFPSETENSAQGVSSRGDVIVGFVGWNTADPTFHQAWRWTQTGGRQDLGDLPGGEVFSQAHAVSADGSVVVGESKSTNGLEAFLWTASGGMQVLGDLEGGITRCGAGGISADGTIVAGTGNTTRGPEAFIWTATEGMRGLGGLSGDRIYSGVGSISADGSTIVGASNGPNQFWRNEAFRWTEADGMQSLGHLPGDSWSVAYGVSGDGSVVVGNCGTDTTRRAFIWDSTHGMRDFKEMLINDYGLGSELNGWTLDTPWAITPDGLSIVGQAYNPDGYLEGWVVNIPEPCTLSLLALGGVVLARRRR